MRQRPGVHAPETCLTACNEVGMGGRTKRGNITYEWPFANDLVFIGLATSCFEGDARWTKIDKTVAEGMLAMDTVVVNDLTHLSFG